MSDLLDTYDQYMPTTWSLLRLHDASGVSGTGVVADGVTWTDGSCAMRWRTEYMSTTIYASMADVEAIHGHGGSTVIVRHGAHWRHGVDSAVQDRCENAQWGSVMDAPQTKGNADILRGRYAYRRPKWASTEWPDDRWHEYLAGYITTAARMTACHSW